MSLRDTEVSPDLSCAQELAKEMVDQTAFAQVLPGPIPSSTLLNKWVRGHRASEGLSTHPPPPPPPLHTPSSQSSPSSTALMASRPLFKLTQICLPGVSNYWQKVTAIFIQRIPYARHCAKAIYS